MSEVERRVDVARVGELTAAAGLDQRAIAAELGCSQSTVSNVQRDLGISRPAGRRAKHPPAPTDRRCETCDTPLVFRFPSDAYRQEGGQLVERRYCSDECKYEALSKYPKPEPRACAGCGGTFTPLRAYSDARYCSTGCTRTGELVACARCGEQVYLPGWAIERGYRFCSPRCWGLARWHDGIALDKLIELKGPRARKVWKGRWGARQAGRVGGKQPVEKVYPELGVRVVGLRRDGETLRAIAADTGLTKREVEGVLARAGGLSP